MYYRILFWLSFLIVFQSPSLVYGQNWLIQYLLPTDYDPEIPPIIDGEVYVNSTIQIHTFRIVDEQEVSVIVLNVILFYGFDFFFFTGFSCRS